MVDWGTVVGLGTLIGAVFGLLIGHILFQEFVPKDHGAGIPQDPDSGVFTGETFFLWLVVRSSASISGAILGHLGEPAVLRIWESMGNIEQMGATFVTSVLLLSVLNRVYRSEVYQN